MPPLTKLSLSLAVGLYDRTFALFDGRVGIEGCEINPIALAPAESFHRACRFAEFDITELSLSSHALMTSAGTSEYVGVPAFTSRAFRHSGIYIRTDRGIERPEDLRGKIIGLPEYQQTATVFIRGFLRDEHGIDAAEIRWRRGGVEEPGRDERSPFKLSTDIDLQPVSADQSLSNMLAAGDIDGIISAAAPTAFLGRTPHVARLFPDYMAAEQAYYQRARIFPIMHLIGVRRSLVEKHPWLPVNVYKAFAKAKQIAVEKLGVVGHLAVTLPWAVAQQVHARSLLGEDYWSYGNTDANRHVLSTFMRYLCQQGLMAEPMPWERLFASSTLDLSKN
jgi:4,5-dihydroxyphthalate decarboxylase